ASMGAGRPVEVQAPYADLTDSQVADLILDMDLPIWTCWWNQGPGAEPGAVAERDHWARLLKAAGLESDLPTAPPPPEIVSRPTLQPARRAASHRTRGSA